MFNEAQLEEKENNIINALRININNSIQQFKELNFDEMDSKYFLKLTRNSLIQCLQTCDYVLQYSDKINAKYAMEILK